MILLDLFPIISSVHYPYNYFFLTGQNGEKKYNTPNLFLLSYYSTYFPILTISFFPIGQSG